MKVLVMSHTPFTDYEGMGKTLGGLFSDFSPDAICQFYVFPSLPNIKNCKGIYRLTDKEAFVSICRRQSAGRRILSDEIQFDNSKHKKNVVVNRYYDHLSFKELKIFIRDALWRLSAWNNKTLTTWLAEEKPDIIFAAPGASGFFYRIIEQIASSLGIPYVTYVCDDFYFSTQKKKGLFLQCYAKYIRRIIKQHMEKASHAVAISDELAQDYAHEFGCSCTTISTGASIAVAPKAAHSDSSNTVSYFGNLLSGRYESLVAVARMIDLYNVERGANVLLEVYSPHDTPQIRAAFAEVRCVYFGGFLPSDKMYEKMEASSLLIHVESFEAENIEKVKYSISTKIADSLSSGICLFSYAPAGVASLEYLRRNNCAYTATNATELREKLFSCLSDAEGRRTTAEKALEIARENHVATQQSKRLRSVLAGVIAKKEQREHA